MHDETLYDLCDENGDTLEHGTRLRAQALANSLAEPVGIYVIGEALPFLTVRPEWAAQSCCACGDDGVTAPDCPSHGHER